MEEEQQLPTPNNENKNPMEVVTDSIDKLFGTINHFITAKYSHDKTGLYIHWAIVGTILIGIIILAIVCKLNDSIVGTLLGTLIGFAFGNFPKSSKGNDNK